MSSLAASQYRAELYRRIREYFFNQNVLEVETPLLGRSVGIDAHIDVIEVKEEAGLAQFLQTSPELFMKRMLCKGYPSVYQICKAFRREEHGRRHRQEFSILEWYRLGWSQKMLMEEVAHLCQLALGACTVVYKPYRQVFRDAVGLDPIDENLQSLRTLYSDLGGPAPEAAERTDALNFILSEKIQPNLPLETLTFVYNFPLEQACLAQPDREDSATANRFEAFYGGVELCNGFEELIDAKENKQRLDEENSLRSLLGKGALPIDKEFLEDLEVGLPSCSGVALGLDRLIMLGMGKNDIGDVLEFS